MNDIIFRDKFFERGVKSENIRIRQVFKQVLIERCKCSEFGECNFCMETKELFGKIFEDQRNNCSRMKTMHTWSDWYHDNAIFMGFVRHCTTCECIEITKNPCKSMK
jgi:hypothetical protein